MGLDVARSHNRPLDELELLVHLARMLLQLVHHLCLSPNLHLDSGQVALELAHGLLQHALELDLVLLELSLCQLLTIKLVGDGVQLPLELLLVRLLLGLELGLDDELALEVLELRVEQHPELLEPRGDLLLGLDGPLEAVHFVLEALLVGIHLRLKVALVLAEPGGAVHLALQLLLDLLALVLKLRHEVLQPEPRLVARVQVAHGLLERLHEVLELVLLVPLELARRTQLRLHLLHPRLQALPAVLQILHQLALQLL
mmetsp:Transcript_929/g.2245  ORF Transcript_929/g.2245 Transcript_929/m.2245 type:complete len:257 (+) Transcript_929:1430-2200(+)